MGPVVSILRRNAVELSQRTALRFLADGVVEVARATFDELDASVRAIAAQLQEQELAGERILILHPPGLAYIRAFLACLYAGAIAVPVGLPRSARLLQRITAIVDNARPAAAFVPQGSVNLRPDTLASIPKVLYFEDELDLAWADRWSPPSLQDSSLAFIQYTSGSTGTPRGVMVTHANLSHQEQLLRQHCAFNVDSRMVTWLPPYHDMGLVGGLLAPLYVGFECIWMDSAAFLRRPVRWLQAISRYRATVSGAPNFAYDLCVDQIDASLCHNIDLASWHLAFTGAEPVNPQTLARFAEAFSRCGFEYRAFWPCYGLAEATLMVTGGCTASGPRLLKLSKTHLRHNQVSPSTCSTSAEFVSSGFPVQSVAIVDPRTQARLDDDCIGEIWVRGGSVALGFWQNVPETALRFAARIPGSSDLYLRTGDLGFLDRGELFISGRLSDLIIIRGRNHYPQDLERTAESAHSLLRRNASVAFGIEVDGKEAAVIVAEISRRLDADLQEIIASVRTAEVETHGIDLHAVLLIRSGQLRRTTSGKPQRRAMKELFLDGALTAVASWVAPKASEASTEPLAAEALECIVVRVWQETLGVSKVEAHDDFFLQGGNSLKAMQLSGRLADELQRELPADVVFESPLLSDLIQRAAASPPMIVRFSQKLDSSDAGYRDWAPLSEAQQRIWFLEQVAPNNPFYHIAVRLDLQEPVDVYALQSALDGVAERHQALRATFSDCGGQLRQNFHSPIRVPLIQHDCSGSDGDAMHVAIERAEVTRAFDLANGPLLRVHVLRLPERAAVLLVVHHLICDGWGMRVLLHELAARYAAARRRQRLVLPSIEYDFGHYCCDQVQHSTRQRSRHREYWRSTLRNLPPRNLPTDLSETSCGVLRGGRVSRPLDAAFVAAITRIASQHGASTFMILVCALQLVVARWTGRDDVIIGAAVANRSEPRLQRLLGCLINFVVIRVSFANAAVLADAVTETVRACREALAHQEYPFQELIRDIAPSERLGRMPLYRVGLWMHDYFESLDMGGVTGVWPTLVDTATAELDLRLLATPRPDGGLQLDLEYRDDRFHCATAQATLESYLTVLKLLIEEPGFSLQNLELACTSRASARRLRVIANFTATPMSECVNYWLRRLALDAHIEFAPSDTIIGELLAPPTSGNDRDIVANILLIDLEAWLSGTDSSDRIANLQFSAQRLARTLISAARPKVTSLVYVCPRSADAQSTTDLRHAFDEARALLSSVGALADNIHTIDLEQLLPLYKVSECRDAFTQLLGGIPFTDEFFAATGAIVARHLHTLVAKPRKVVAVDCDDTLWTGNCAEFDKVGVTDSHRTLHRRLDALHREGFLLCLLSKNADSDVLNALRSRDVQLAEHKFVARRVDWFSKADNLRALAQQLRVGVDSFVFLDDSPVECAEMRARCPEVLTVQVQHDGDAQAVLDHLWPLDRLSLTDEDRARNDMYTAEAARSALLYGSNHSLAEFLADLRIKVDLMPARAEDLPRVVQLLQRTTQFNLTGLGYSLTQLTRWLAQPGMYCVIAKVSDRYGDYGLAGAALSKFVSSAMHVQNLVLSCRVLGRNVEFIMLEKLCEWAIAHQASEIVLTCTPTGRNVPAVNCIKSLFPQAGRDALGLMTNCSATATLLSQLRVGARVLPVSDARDPGESTIMYSPDAATIWRTRRLEEIASQHWSAVEIIRQMRRDTLLRPTEAGEYVAPREGLETLVATLMADVLQVERVGRHDAFFQLGGYSLLAVRFLARIRDACSVHISLEQLFAGPTVAELAPVIATAMVAADGTSSVETMMCMLDGMSDDEARAVLVRGDRVNG